MTCQRINHTTVFSSTCISGFSRNQCPAQARCYIHNRQSRLKSLPQCVNPLQSFLQYLTARLDLYERL